jgi:dinuclear metal center YbgI/SA1388 family protein
MLAMRVEQIITALRKLAPEALAEPWDKVGLQVGDPRRVVRRAMLCIDLTEPVLDEAVRKRVQMVIAYHPPIFEPLGTLTTTSSKSRIILRAAEERIAVYSPHTALDAAAGGINDWFAACLADVGSARAIRVSHAPSSSRYVLVTFVPPHRADELRTALARAGAGKIGEYTECSFNLVGTGTFKGGAASRPTIGKRGVFERVTELRMEMTCPDDRLSQVIAALREAHPYETPAFDLYKVEAATDAARDLTGQGRVVRLHRPVTQRELIERVKRRLRIKHLEVSVPPEPRPLRLVAFCAGAGGSLLKEAGDIDAFVTGEMRHHDVLAAQARGIAVLLPGHTQAERPYLPVYRGNIIRATGERGVEWLISRADAPPAKWV